MDKIFNIKDFSHLKKESTIEIYSILKLCQKKKGQMFVGMLVF